MIKYKPLMNKYIFWEECGPVPPAGHLRAAPRGLLADLHEVHGVLADAVAGLGHRGQPRLLAGHGHGGLRPPGRHLASPWSASCGQHHMIRMQADSGITATHSQSSQCDWPGLSSHWPHSPLLSAIRTSSLVTDPPMPGGALAPEPSKPPAQAVARKRRREEQSQGYLGAWWRSCAE